MFCKLANRKTGAIFIHPAVGEKNPLQHPGLIALEQVNVEINRADFTASALPARRPAIRGKYL